MDTHEVIVAFNNIMSNSNKFERFIFDEELKMFTDNEIEYQIREYCVLIRFCDEPTNNYIELYFSEFKNAYELADCALYEVTDRLAETIMESIMMY